MAVPSVPQARVNTIANHVGLNPYERSTPAVDIKIDSWSISPKPLQVGGTSSPVELQNLVNGKWVHSEKYLNVIDPLTGGPMVSAPETQVHELEPFLTRMAEIPKSGLHNPLKNVDRYVKYGEITFKIAQELNKPEVADHFTHLIQRCVPKSYAQAMGEVVIVRRFLQNFCSDQVRFLARGFHVSGDHDGQQSSGYRWPFGAVCIIAPFNFPLEIPILQLMGALYMGNHVTIKGAEKASWVLEEYIRLAIKCGMPATDVNLIHCMGSTMAALVDKAHSSKILRAMQFTGSNQVAKAVSIATCGKVRIEDAGFNWKVTGPDVSDLEFVAYTCDQDAYANCGQKCSAQSILFLHKNWYDSNLLQRMSELSGSRSLKNLTVAPVITQTTEGMLGHLDKILKTCQGSRILFGGYALADESKNQNTEEVELAKKIPKCYGAIKPTAIFVPLKEIMKSDEAYHLVTTEIFGPFQVVTCYEGDAQLEIVLQALEKMENHLTACVMSNNIQLQDKVLGRSVNGTTYCGIRGRTTGAPQNHWFGPCGDPRAAGIGSPEAIKLVWSAHREIIRDSGPVPSSWKRPDPS